MIDWKHVERRALYGTRLVTLVAVVSSFAGALLMFWLGLANTWRAFATQLGEVETALPADDLAVIHLIGALDRFLIAIVLMFFGYGIYVLFVRPGATPRQLGLPEWLRVESVGQLKQTLAEVIVIVLFVLFLRVALETFAAGAAAFGWQGVLAFRSLPVAIALLTAGLRLAQLYPKPVTRGRAAAEPGAASDRHTASGDAPEGPSSR